MRKLIWLALAVGAVELVKRQAHRRGIAPSALLSTIAAGAVARLAQPATKA